MKQLLYEETACRMIKKIDAGEWQIGQKLPGELELSRLYGVGRSTVREALNLLLEKGMIIKKNGSGSYVRLSSPTLNNPLNQLNSIGEMIRAAGCVPKSIWYRLEHGIADGEMGKELDLPAGEPVVIMLRGREADRIPVAFSCNIFPEKYVGNLFDSGVEGKMFSLLQERCGIRIHHAETRISGLNKSREWDRMAWEFLKSSIVMLRQLHYDSEGRKIFCSWDYLNTEVIELNLTRDVRE